MSETEGGSPPLLQGLFPIKLNVGEEVFRSNIEASIKRDLPWLNGHEAHGGQVLIVAGGPSLNDSQLHIKQMRSAGFKIISVSNTLQWLLDRNIVPDYHIMLDAQARVARFVVKHEGIKYLIASQCAPETFDAAGETTLWHPHIPGIQEFIGDRECALIGGGTTVGLQAMSIAYTLGFRRIHLVGFDSSYREGEGHAYKQFENEGEPVVNVIFNGKRFVCARWMCHQVEEFKGILNQLLDADCQVSVYGQGYLQEVFHDLLKTVLTAVYDLAVSPPTYDFISFLYAAEQARIKGGHTHLDVIFMPGPIGGFRDDNLPPSIPEREGMLHRICVSACRLLPSVRTVTVRKDRQPVAGNIFPEGWSVLTPVSQYGSNYLRNATPIFRATQSAISVVKRERPYVTVTLRQAEYWPERNSNLEAWDLAIEWLESEGYDVVILRDTNKSVEVSAWDIDMRLALYEGAKCNLGVANGPMALLFASKAPYIMFKPMTESCPSTTVEFLRRYGMEVGGQWSANGTTVWESDDYDVIVREVSKFLGIDVYKLIYMRK